MLVPVNEPPRLPRRKAESHKGDFGSALLVGGSRGMSGAIGLAGMSAARTGAGTVTLAVPDICLDTVASFSPCLMSIPLPSLDGKLLLGDPQTFDRLGEKLSRASCLAIGPGLGQSADLQSGLMTLLQQVACPVVIDADGLNNLAYGPNGKDFAWRQVIPQPVVITPHPGEWSRLSGVPAGDREGQIAAAISAAAEHDLVIVLKGHQSLVTDGNTVTRNETGTPAMATGGSGDVLTGMIAALICQKLTPLQATQLGAWVHGKAGELASERLNSHVALPTDLIDSLPAALSLL